MEKKAIEQTGLIPRSIIRTFDRFWVQLMPGSENLMIQEFRISRYQVIVSTKCLLSLILIPFLVNYFAKLLILMPLTEYLWNTQQSEIFLNSYQQNRAFRQIQDFQEKFYFEELVNPQNFSTKDTKKKETEQLLLTNQIEWKIETKKINFQLQKKFQKKISELAFQYNKESIQGIANVFGDFISFGTIILLILGMKPQIIILTSFLTESIYSLSDTTKSFLLILFTDLLVGFHSPRGWEFILELILRHFGLPENPDFIFLFVATFPVLLDTVFKYWIFRYLNKISPSTVATYHSMIE